MINFELESIHQPAKTMTESECMQKYSMLYKNMKLEDFKDLCDKYFALQNKFK